MSAVLKKSFRIWFVALLQKRSPHLFERLFLFFLSILSFIYASLVRLRVWLYQIKLFKSDRLPVPVISVGNINVGGSGKTPMVEMLARFYSQKGKRVGILSRGYGRKGGTQRIEQVVFNSTLSLKEQSEKWGDEPLLLAKHLPEAVIYVGQNRVQAGRKMLAEHPIDLILLDDGFQHLRLHREVDLVLLDPSDVKGSVFPRGLLREPLSHLKRATAFIYKEEALQQKLEAQLKKWHPNPKAFSYRLEPHSFIAIPSKEKTELTALKNKKVLLFSGIGRPSSFEQSCRQLGLKVVTSLHYPDHHNYSEEEFDSIIETAKQKKVEAILTTEKDVMRLNHEQTFSVPISFLKISLVSEGLKKADFLSHLW